MRIPIINTTLSRMSRDPMEKFRYNLKSRRDKFHVATINAELSVSHWSSESINLILSEWMIQSIKVNMFPRSISDSLFNSERKYSLNDRERRIYRVRAKTHSNPSDSIMTLFVEKNFIAKSRQSFSLMLHPRLSFRASTALKSYWQFYIPREITEGRYKKRIDQLKFVSQKQSTR